MAVAQKTFQEKEQERIMLARIQNNLRSKLNNTQLLGNFLDDCERALGFDGAISFYKVVMPAFNKAQDVAVFIDIFDGKLGGERFQPYQRQALQKILKRTIGG